MKATDALTFIAALAVGQFGIMGLHLLMREPAMLDVHELDRLVTVVSMFVLIGAIRDKRA